jgi:hypothetical protein
LVWLAPFAGNSADYVALPIAASLPLTPYCCLHTPFGQIVPNVHDWRTGDVVVVRAPRGLAGAPIVAYQSLIFGMQEPCMWTHVGIYDGNGHVWDAVPTHNVRHRSIAQVAQEGRTISVRRLAGLHIDSHRLTAFLSFQLHQRFSVTAVPVRRLLIHRALRATGLPPLSLLTDEIVFCSILVLRALQYATNGLPFSEIIPLPADFMAKPQFHEVSAHWCQRQANHP